MNFWQVIATALHQRLIFYPPFDAYWFAGMTITLVAAALLGTLIWWDWRKNVKRSKS